MSERAFADVSRENQFVITSLCIRYYCVLGGALGIRYLVCANLVRVTGRVVPGLHGF